MRIFHIAARHDWEEAQAKGAYRVSTLGRSLAEVGFIHACRADQWRAVRRRYYAEVYTPLLLLEIETDSLASPVVEERPAGDTEETFPHIYGPIEPAAVVGVTDITRSKLPVEPYRPARSPRTPLP